MKAFTLTNIHNKWSITVLCDMVSQIETKLADYYIEHDKAEGVMFTRLDMIDYTSDYDVLLSVYYPTGCTRYEMKLDISDVVI